MAAARGALAVLILGQTVAEKQICPPRLTIQEADILRTALLGQIQVEATVLKDRADDLRNIGQERWGDEDNLAHDAYRFAVLARILADLGRDIDDWRLENLPPAGGSPDHEPTPRSRL